MDSEHSGWRTASYSNGQAQCVEVGHAVAAIAVRDSKAPSSALLAVPADAWQRFTSSLK
jgi:hypothetical protein